MPLARCYEISDASSLDAKRRLCKNLMMQVLGVARQEKKAARRLVEKEHAPLKLEGEEKEKEGEEEEGEEEEEREEEEEEEEEEEWKKRRTNQ